MLNNWSCQTPENTVERNHLNVFGVIKVFHKNTFVWHRKTHDEKKSYKCDQCDKSFIKKNRLLIHQRTNSEEKTFKYHHYFFFKCDHCDESFLMKGHLVIHHKTNRGEDTLNVIKIIRKLTKYFSLLLNKSKAATTFFF